MFFKNLFSGVIFLFFGKFFIKKKYFFTYFTTIKFLQILSKVNPECSNIKLVQLSNKTKNYIIKLHNELRDKLASGNIEKYPPASRMLQMVLQTIISYTFNITILIFSTGIMNSKRLPVFMPNTA